MFAQPVAQNVTHKIASTKSIVAPLCPYELRQALSEFTKCHIEFILLPWDTTPGAQS